MKAIIKCKKWTEAKPPKKILAIRFQALGDTLITLPYLYDLKLRLPDTEIDFLTRKEVSPIPLKVSFFNSVMTLGGKRSAKVQFILAMLKLPFLLFQNYDVVLDLQNNKISRTIRKCLSPKCWSEFDRSSPISAGERTRQTINAANIAAVDLNPEFKLKPDVLLNVYEKFSLKKGYSHVVLNPAGFFASRNWPLENYISFARLWLQQVNPKTLFILLLLPSLREKATRIKESLGEHCVDLTGKANQVEAFQILKSCDLILTEDSGLMHMAWVQGIPTIALFSSSRKDWSQPLGKNSICLDSSDLECGPCMLEVCKFNNNLCLTRYSPEFVLKKVSIIIPPDK